MKLKEIYEIQATADFSSKSGHTPDEALAADRWLDRIGHLAAHLSWHHEVDPKADADSLAFGDLWETAPTIQAYHKLIDTYEMAGLIATHGPICMMENE